MWRTITAPKNSMRKTSRQIFVSDWCGTFAEAQKIAKEHSGELPSLQEFIIELKDKNKFARAEGQWYWLREQGGSNILGPCKIDYKKGGINDLPLKG